MLVKALYESSSLPTRIEVRALGDVGHARRVASWLASSRNAERSELERIEIVTTELATNLARYAHDGEIVVQNLGASTEIFSLDRGPGIPDISQALRDGFSSENSLGLGLGAVRRQSDDFGIFSRPSLTSVYASVGSEPRGGQDFGVMYQQKKGESACGDGWLCAIGESLTTLALVDGLGHGEAAQDANRVALGELREAPFQPVGDAIDRMHSALCAAQERGGVGAVFQTDGTSFDFAGVGNLAARVIRREGDQEHLVSKAGTLGDVMPSLLRLQGPLGRDDVFVMETDGVRSRWRASEYAGLMAQPAALIAAVLQFDRSSGRDDAAVIAFRAGGTA